MPDDRTVTVSQQSLDFLIGYFACSILPEEKRLNRRVVKEIRTEFASRLLREGGPTREDVDWMRDTFARTTRETAYRSLCAAFRRKPSRSVLEGRMPLDRALSRI